MTIEEEWLGAGFKTTEIKGILPENLKRPVLENCCTLLAEPYHLKSRHILPLLARESGPRNLVTLINVYIPLNKIGFPLKSMLLLINNQGIIQAVLKDHADVLASYNRAVSKQRDVKQKPAPSFSVDKYLEEFVSEWSLEEPTQSIYGSNGFFPMNNQEPVGDLSSSLGKRNRDPGEDNRSSKKESTQTHGLN